MRIAIDFDGTLCEEEYPNIGRGNTNVIAKVWEAIEKGHVLTLWTCRQGKLLEKAVQWCKELGLNFRYYNGQSEKDLEHYGNSRKIGSDLYVDDKSPGSIEYFLGMKL